MDEEKQRKEKLVEFKENKIQYGEKVFGGLLKSNEAFDKMLVLISSGGLALSMAFVEKLGGENPNNSSYLILSWVFLGLTLFASLLSSLISSEVHRKAYKSNNEILLDIGSLIQAKESVGDNASEEEKVKANSRINKIQSAIKHKIAEQDRNITRLNGLNHKVTYSSLLLLLIGVFFLILFASVNVLDAKPNPPSTLQPALSAKHS